MNNDITLKIQFDANYSDFTININSSIADLKSQILSILKNKFNFNPNPSSLVIRFGFPPRTISSPDSNNLRSLSITNNELLRVECSKLDLNKSEQKPTNAEYIKKGNIERVVIPADNSCLFNAVNYCLNQSMNEPETMREIIASTIMSNTDFYNAAILDKEPSDYCAWILQKETWGGGIELAILSNFFQIRIGVADITKVTIEYFGEVF
jgi:ubiquitin thioesterase OTU1